MAQHPETDVPAPEAITAARAARGIAGASHAGRHRNPAASVWTLAAALLGFFMITLDAVIVNVALPSIHRDLGGGITALQWVVDAYTLMFASLLLSSGALSDRVGARRAFGIGIAAFVVASGVCGLAPDTAVLVGARVLQGAAAALVMPSSMALLGHAYPDSEARARAVALWATGGALASTCGPVVGGLLTAASWRLIFIVNLPVGALTLALLSRAARTPRHPVPMDWAGQLTGVITVTSLTYAAIEAGAAGPVAPQVLVGALMSIVALIAFVVIERRAHHPIVPGDLVRSRPVRLSVVIGFAFMVGFYGMPFVMSLYLQQLRGASAVAAGATFVPMMAVGLALTPLTAHFAERVGAPRLIMAGLVCLGGGMVVLAALPASVPIGVVTALLVVVGLAGPFTMPPTMTVLLHAVPAHRAGVAGGLFNTSRQIGGALAIAVFGALIAAPGGFLHGYRLSLQLGAAVAGLALLVVIGGRAHIRTGSGR